ncbi:MAG: Coenzyme F420 hydrogenase/dehydrogenase, beta subunit C-terminal domain [Alistipes sp.]|nr:Coenzyme F420 hydrogenase/dehydrogenase, beta subunit C-terminal domain [Alistipes sp.]
MITITDKRDCCGCEACVQCCPKQCIAMRTDEEGFSYPETDASRCIECGLCERVCPILNCGEPRKPLKVYAAKNPNDDIRMKSSSGGIFTMLAEKTVSEGGVVFGARFNEKWEVVHDHTETKEGLAAFRGSKYVQSRIGREYVRAKEYLAAGRKVLFSGTPCQIAGLRRYLGKRYDNLLTVDIVCHGVPSPFVWKRYLDESKSQQRITEISMRDKTTGWTDYGILINGIGAPIVKEPAAGNIYMRGFLRELYNRPSCHACPARGGRSGSDITIGDYWGIHHLHPEFVDPNGVGLIMIRTDKGAEEFADLDTINIETTYEEAVSGNPSIECDMAVSVDRAEFFAALPNGRIADICKRILKRYEPSRLRIAASIIKQHIKRLLR